MFTLIITLLVLSIPLFGSILEGEKEAAIAYLLLFFGFLLLVAVV